MGNKQTLSQGEL